MTEMRVTTGPADLLIVGGLVMSSTDQAPAVAGTVVIKSGVIVDVLPGSLLRRRDLRGPRTEVVDVHGATLSPGLVDGHIHPVMGLDLIGSADLSACRTVVQVRHKLAAHAQRLPDDSWLTASGLDPNVFGDEPPDNVRLSVGPRPSLLHFFDGHAALANGTALALAGVTGALDFPSGARVVVDRQGRPTGLLQEEAAIQLVAGLIPAAPFALRRRQLVDLLQRMAATGLTGGQVMDAKGDALELFAALDGSDELPLRLGVSPWCRPNDDPGPLMDLQGTGGRMWQVAGVKMFLDGTIDGGTAWLSHPDCLGESASPGWDPATYSDRLRTFDSAGIATATHAIGDAAVRHVLDSIEQLARVPPGPSHRIEHLESIPDELVSRFAQLGVSASMQPSHATDYTRADGSDNWSRRLGVDRAATGWRCADLARSGANLILGSDWPVAPFDPRVTMAAAVLRRPPAEPDKAAVQSDQALTITEALRASTAAPARASGARRGRIAAGFDADITVFEHDPRTVSGSDVAELPVTHTVSGGRITFRLD